LPTHQKKNFARSDQKNFGGSITALLADIKSSTALMEKLDQEEARAISDLVLQLMMDAVHRYNGYVVQGSRCVKRCAAGAAR